MSFSGTNHVILLCFLPQGASSGRPGATGSMTPHRSAKGRRTATPKTPKAGGEGNAQLRFSAKRGPTKRGALSIPGRKDRSESDSETPDRSITSCKAPQPPLDNHPKPALQGQGKMDYFRGLPQWCDKVDIELENYEMDVFIEIANSLSHHLNRQILFLRYPFLSLVPDLQELDWECPVSTESDLEKLVSTIQC